jgi:hypothetical protein
VDMLFFSNRKIEHSNECSRKETKGEEISYEMTTAIVREKEQSLVHSNDREKENEDLRSIVEAI